MGIYSFLNRSAKKDERITELEAQVARLTDQNTKIAEANQETERILADQDVFIAALKADNDHGPTGPPGHGTRGRDEPG